MLTEITRKVLSYCEIPEELTESHWISDHSCDCYIEYTIPFGIIQSNLNKWITKTYPELIGTTFLIHIDY